MSGDGSAREPESDRCDRTAGAETRKDSLGPKTQASQREDTFTEIRLTSASKDDDANGGANGSPPIKHSASFKKVKDGLPSNPGKFRHVVAILALSSIVLANMNRQAYNQALSRMIRPSHATRTPPAPEMSAEYNQTDNYNNLEANPTTTLRFDSLDDVVTTPAISTTGDLGGDAATTTNPIDASEHESNEIVAEHYDDDDLFDWDAKKISLLQTAFSWGYMPFMIPGGRLSEIYGAKWIVFLSGFGSAICSIVTPFLADHSFTLLMGSRILMGICQTGVSPALFALLTRWMTPDESSVYLAMIKVGVMIGFMAGSFINGFLSWRMTFYSVGLISVLWSVMWALCVTSTPDEHKFMSASELAHIKQAIGLDVDVKKQEPGDDANEKKKTSSAPWMKIITSRVVLAFMFTKFTIKLSTDTQSMQLPMYMKNVLKISDKLNGPLNGANFAIQAIFTGMVAYLAKEMVVRKSFGLDKTGVRKIFQAVQNFGMAGGYALIALNMDSLPLVCCAVMLISVASMFGSGGEAVLPVDLTRKYSASIMAIANSLANLSGIVLPPTVSFLLQNQLDNPDTWVRVWWFVSGLMVAGGAMFLLFVNAQIQDFDHDDDEDDQLAVGKSKPETSQGTVIEMQPKVQIKGFDEE